MDFVKSPISVLQELAQIKHLARPLYELYPETVGYRCYGSIGDILKTATGLTKKQAKHICAQKMLAVLQASQDYIPLKYERNIMTEKESLQPIEPVFNAVGKLNELFCKSANHPKYSDLEMKDKMYVIQCKLLSYTTQGKAPSKKRAKQIAAHEMLNRINSTNMTSSCFENEKSRTKLTYSSEMEEEVIQLFRYFSIRNKETIKKTEFIETEKKTKCKTDDVKLISKVNSKEELEAILTDMGVSYEINELQSDPLVLLLKTSPMINHASYSFIYSDKTYNAALNGLLKKAIQHLNVLLN